MPPRTSQRRRIREDLRPLVGDRLDMAEDLPPLDNTNMDQLIRQSHWWVLWMAQRSNSPEDEPPPVQTGELGYLEEHPNDAACIKAVEERIERLRRVVDS